MLSPSAVLLGVAMTLTNPSHGLSPVTHRSEAVILAKIFPLKQAKPEAGADRQTLRSGNTHRQLKERV